MEALTAASVSALTIYDMCKSVDKYENRLNYAHIKVVVDSYTIENDFS